ncbi:MAG: hypothetical protein OXG10_01275 [Candidatus Dadabacteria bacterium]|nr:hypothetical protein [Candidatus Dadabacteria bacterium]
MRLRNLFMILLLCMTVGVFGVSCTGDDGAQGPQGEQGEKGDPGEVTEGDLPEAVETYSFLESWGVAEGVSCSSDILSTEADLPGPDLADISATGQGNLSRTNDINNGVSATCADSIFGNIVAMQKGGINLDDPAPAGNQIYLYKTSRTEKSIVEKVPTEKTAFSLDILTTTTKDIVGGKVYAKLETTGGDEAIERQLLHSQCTKGTDPPDIVGDFRAVKIVTAAQEFVNSMPCTAGTNCTPATKTTTKYKVCVRLDAHPGQVKCLVVDKGVTPDPTPSDDKTFIGLYDGMDVSDQEVDITATVSSGNFFGDTAAEVAGAYAGLCHLFGLE